MQVGVQPLDHIMLEHGWENHVLVEASDRFLTHKVVQKARRGRRLTRRAQEKVVHALNRIPGGEVLRRQDIFNYEGT